MGKNNVSFLLMAFLCLLILSGCWDDVELEDRGFLSGVSVDLADEEQGKLTFELTSQFVVPAGLGSATEQGGGEAYRNLSQTGESLFYINSAISRQANRKVNVEHLDIVIFSTPLMEKENVFSDLIDVFIRQQNMRRGILLAVTEGKAKELLDMKTEHELIPAQYISELLENPESGVTTAPVRLGDIQEKLLKQRSFILPHLKVYSENSIDYEGLAIFRGKTSQWVGSVKEEEAKGTNIVRGQDQEGSIITEVEGDLVTFEIRRGDSSFQLHNQDKNSLDFTVKINLETRIAEYFGTLNLYEKKNVEKFTTEIEDEIKQLAENAIKKVKDELKVDIFELDEFLRMKHYDLWKEVEDDWDSGENYFSRSNINVEVDVRLIGPGNSIRIKEGE